MPGLMPGLMLRREKRKVNQVLVGMMKKWPSPQMTSDLAPLGSQSILLASNLKYRRLEN